MHNNIKSEDTFFLLNPTPEHASNHVTFQSIRTTPPITFKYTWSFARRLLKNPSLACAFFFVRLKFTNFQASSYHVSADQVLKLHQ